MNINDFNFDLPETLIARYPLAKRSASRLLYCAAHSAKPLHGHFANVIDFLEAGDLLVFNDTKVMKARLLGRKTTGGRVELLVERILNNQEMLAQIRASKGPRIDETLLFDDDIKMHITGRSQHFFKLHYPASSCQAATILEVIEKLGQIPLPPYIKRRAEKSDEERYQTIYAKHKGSVAAPTAGLHFDEELLAKLKDKKICFGFLTLHIGAGTFMPIRVNNIAEHHMHAEYVSVSPSLCQQITQVKAQGKRVIAVGTTSLRALESASKTGNIAPFQGETNLFVYPGYTFHCVDALITNFHLPRSSLLILVCALGGYEKVMQAYGIAVKESYRFYSYGDAMMINRSRC